MAEAPKLYEVVDVRERTTVTPEGTFQKLMEVTFRTRGGTVASLMIPEEEFSQAEAAKRVEERAKEIEAVRALRK